MEAARNFLPGTHKKKKSTNAENYAHSPFTIRHSTHKLSAKHLTPCPAPHSPLTTHAHVLTLITTFFTGALSPTFMPGRCPSPGKKIKKVPGLARNFWSSAPS